ncbi:C2 domain containing protein [Nitzschia inconspicua]|uniref:C2 domain containing protein n=1 Tax=Nitzschia inconspicua TaxID=303405 RepID=A0A9K3LNT2_9STRA|nr:C2 domain containing protein [Nitzschia inconspicua]
MFQACFGDRNKSGVPSDTLFDKNYVDNDMDYRFSQKLLDDHPASQTVLSSPNSSSGQGQQSTNVLLEIVGATALQDLSRNIDTFCIVKVSDREVHRTKTIYNDFQPVFTCKTKSLCLLKHLKEQEKVEVQLCRPNNIVPGAFKVIGSTILDYNKLVHGLGERHEFNICQDDKMILLALRFREATPEDLAYFASKKGTIVSSGSLRNITSRRDVAPAMSSNKDHASDINFKNVTKKSLLQQHQKTVHVENGKDVAYRVFPGPDPKDPNNTTFMTKKQMDKFLEDPSREWVEAGWGDFGSVYLEILGCDNLPQMDTEMIDGLTDPFACIVFEDTFVRSSVIFDNLNPRWPPWSQRAIKFNIGHPSSVIYVGIFDYDENYLDNHDPIGRVVLHLDSFDPDTVYTLKYALFNGDAPKETDKGTVTLRLEIRWKKTLVEVSRAQSYLAPPRFIINTETERSWKTIRYLTRGAVDMSDVTIDSCKVFANELSDHLREYCYLFDVAFSIFLWRGTSHFSVFGKNFSFWFPLDSMVLFTAVALSLEFPVYVPSIVLYSFVFAMLRKNFCLSSNPSPWLRKKSFTRVALTNIGFKPRSAEIVPDIGVQEARMQARIEEYRMHRVTGFLYESLKIALQVYKVYSKTSPVDISTVSKSGGLMSSLYVNYLTYLHVLLKNLNKYIRISKNFATWQSHSTYGITVKCFVFATVWLCFPYKSQSCWIVRVVAWVSLGPWMKFLDVFWIRKYYRTREELIRDGVPETADEMREDIASRPNILEPLLKSNLLETMSNRGRVVVEDSVKLRDFREEFFGKYSETIPLVDTSRFPSVPLPSSYACPRGDRSKNNDLIEVVDADDTPSWTYVVGQKLFGNMIPQQRL